MQIVAAPQSSISIKLDLRAEIEFPNFARARAQNKYGADN